MAEMILKLHKPKTSTTTALRTPAAAAPQTVNIKEATKSTWRMRRNLVGNPPVKGENPPNTAIVENESKYKDLHSSVAALVKIQEDRARHMLGQHGPHDLRYWFTRVYSIVTKNELKFAEENAYYYPSYVMRCVLYFDKLYADNIAMAEKDSRKVEQHWREAFATAKAQQAVGQSINEYSIFGAVYSLVAHMLAHIRYDLPRAESWVFKSNYERPGVRIEDFRPDFFSMSGVFDNATREMFGIMETQFKKMGNGLGRTFAQFTRENSLGDDFMRDLLGANMSTERLMTWLRTEELAKSGKGGANPYTYTPGSSGKPGKLNGDVTGKGDLNSGFSSLRPGLRPSLAGIKNSAPLDMAINVGKGILGVSEAAKDFTADSLTAGIGLVMNKPEKIKTWSWEKKSGVILALMGKQSLTVLANIMLNKAANLNFEPLAAPLAQSYVVRIVQAAQSAGQLSLIVGACDAFSILRMLDANRKDTVSKIFGKYYYPQLDVMNAVNQCMKWIEKDGIQSNEAVFIYESMKTVSDRKATSIRSMMLRAGYRVSWK